MIQKNKNCLEENFDFKKNVPKKKRCSKYKGTITFKKEVGETPLEVLENFKKENLKYKDTKFAYAGRLDPMAEGRLLVLVGDTCKERDKYLNLDKEYEFEILLGFKSDTKDLLGLAELNPWHTTWVGSRWFNNQLKSYIGKIELEYPVFSSRTVKNKPLFLWALENRLNEIEIPKKKSEIYNLKLISQKKISSRYLNKLIIDKINLPTKVEEESKELGKNFRRGEIVPLWNKLFSEKNEDEKFLVLKIRAVVSSGTYMRTLAEKIADEILEDYGVAYSIKRTKIGIYKRIFSKIGFWKKTY